MDFIYFMVSVDVLQITDDDLGYQTSRHIKITTEYPAYYTVEDKKTLFLSACAQRARIFSIRLSIEMHCILYCVGRFNDTSAFCFINIGLLYTQTSGKLQLG